MNPPTTFSLLRCQKIVSSFGTIYSIRRQNTRPERWRGDKYAAINMSFSLGCLAPQRLLVLIKHYNPIAGKLESNNTILQNLQSMDCYTEIYAMLKFHIYISRYRTMVNPTVLTMNISLQELMIIRSIMNLQEKIYRLIVILQVLS